MAHGAGKPEKGLDRPVIRFVDVTGSSGIAFAYHGDLRRGRSLSTLGGGVAAADLDGDGLPELFFTGTVRDGRKPDRGPKGALYRNRGNGRFEDWTARSHIDDQGWAMGAHFFDLEGDGLPDLLVTASGGNRLYRNRGGYSFSVQTSANGLRGGLWSVGAAFLDANRDGRLDVYLGNYLATDYAKEQQFPMFQVRTPDDYDGEENALYLQGPDGHFADATAASGTGQGRGKTLNACAFDADGDGLDDLFVANDRTPNALFKGRGDGTFIDATALSGIGEIADRTGPRAGMGVAAGDADGDGDPDILVTNFGGEPVTYYRNSGGGMFEDATDEAGLAHATIPYVQWGVHFDDLDNDTRADIPIVSGHLVPHVLTTMARLFHKGGAGPYGRGCRAYRQPAILFRGTGGGRFEDVTAGSGALARMRISGRGSVCADFNGDGLLDLAVTAVSGGVRVLLNATDRAGHALELLPAPGVAGRPGADTIVGTRVAVTSRGIRQVKEFGVVPSYASGSWLPLHFGLGDAPVADTVEVFPPGATAPAAVYRDLPAGRLYALGPEGPRVIRVFGPQAPGASGR